MRLRKGRVARLSPGGRIEKLAGVSAGGFALLKEWLSGPIDLPEVAHTVDFVRLRVFYLGAATREERASVIDEALQSLGKQLEICRETAKRYEEIGDAFSRLATLGVIAETEARILWLSETREAILSAPVGKPG